MKTIMKTVGTPARGRPRTGKTTSAYTKSQTRNRKITAFDPVAYAAVLEVMD